MDRSVVTERDLERYYGATDCPCSKSHFGQGTGFPTKTSADDYRLFEQSVHRFCDLSTLQ